MNISTSNKKLKSLKRLFYFFTILMFGLSFSSYAYGTDWQTHINKEYGYKIKYPKTWQLAEKGDKSAPKKYADKFQKPAEIGNIGQLMYIPLSAYVDAKLSIIVEESHGLSLEQLLNEDQKKQQQMQKKQNPDIVRRFMTTELPYKIGGQKAIKVITKFENPKKSSKKEEDKGNANIYIMKNDKIYSFDLRNRNMAKEKFETICEAMMKNFSFE